MNSCHWDIFPGVFEAVALYWKCLLTGNPSAYLGFTGFTFAISWKCLNLNFM